MKALVSGMALICACALLAGCTSPMVQLQTPEKGDYKEIGESQGTGVGFMLFGFIPIKQNGRHERAYQQALDRAGGNAMVNPTIHERWFWTPAGDGFITTIKGTVVDEDK